MVSSAASTDAGSVNIVRQPIMDGAGRVFAYELLCHESTSDAGDGDGDDSDNFSN